MTFIIMPGMSTLQFLAAAFVCAWIGVVSTARAQFPAHQPTTQSTEPQAAAAEEAAAAPGPRIELPVVPPPTAATLDAAVGGEISEPARPSSGTVLGGYGELHYNHAFARAGAPSTTRLDLHRLVLLVSHRFDARARVHCELEVEHALVAGPSTPGELSVEQAFVEYGVVSDALLLRGGLVLVPMGIINQWHEPPAFHGVERPAVDRIILPTTWSEGGVGVVGRLTPWLRYELYLVGGLDPRGFRANAGLRGGRRGVAEAIAGFPALTGRLEAEPWLGWVAGVSGYGNLAGENASLGFAAPVVGASSDVRVRHAGFEARAVAAYFSIGDVAKLKRLTDVAGDPLGIDIGSALFGAYAELAYDVLYRLGSDHTLSVFARLEWLDTTLRTSTRRDDRPAQTFVSGGFSYRPLQQLALKFDYVWQRTAGTRTETSVNLGLGWIF